MLANRFLSGRAAALLVAAAMAALGAIQAAAQTARVSPEVVRDCAGVERSIPENSTKACAQALKKSLNAKDADISALKATPKLMLTKYGFTKQQLEGAEIVLKDETGGSGAQRIKSVTITCCPLTITIVF